MPRVTIGPMQAEDWPTVRAIYLEGIATGLATFETEAPSWEQWDADHLTVCCLVARVGERVAGWAAVSPTSKRKVYAGVVEESIYMAAAFRGRGIGKALLTALAAESERQGIWSLQAGIIRENAASISLHRACGFREIGYQERKGCLNGVWRDVALMERRSRSVGG